MKSESPNDNIKFNLNHPNGHERNNNKPSNGRENKNAQNFEAYSNKNRRSKCYFNDGNNNEFNNANQKSYFGKKSYVKNSDDIDENGHKIHKSNQFDWEYYYNNKLRNNFKNGHKIFKTYNSNGSTNGINERKANQFNQKRQNKNTTEYFNGNDNFNFNGYKQNHHENYNNTKNGKENY